MRIINVNLYKYTYLAGIFDMSDSNLKKQINSLRNTLLTKIKLMKQMKV